MAPSTNLSDASSPNASRSWAHELQWEEDEGFLVAEVRYAFIVAYALVSLFGVAGNSAVLVAVWRHRGRCSAMSVLVGNLALADVLVALLCAPFTLASTLLDRWAFGPALCRAVPFLQCLAVMVSTLMLMSIAALRCRVISRPLATQPRGRSGLAWSGAAWLLGACVCAPVPAFYALQDMGEATGLSSMRSRHACVESWPRAADRVCFSVALLALQYVIPLACLTASHTRVCVRLSSTTAAAAAAAAAAATASAAASVIPQTRITLVAVSAQENRIPGGGGDGGDHDDEGDDDDDEGAGGAKRGWEGFLQKRQRSWCGRRLSSITPMLGTKRSSAGRQGPASAALSAAPVSRTASSRLSEQSAHSMPGISEICCEVAPALTTTPIGPERLSLQHHHHHQLHHHHQHHQHHQQHHQQQQQEQDQQHEQSRGHEQHWARASSRRKRRRSRTVYCKSLAVILAFALSWLPLHVFHLVTDFDDSLLDNGAFKLVFCTCHLLGMTSCCLNPVLYGFLNNGLKKEFLAAVRCARPRKLPG